MKDGKIFEQIPYKKDQGFVSVVEQAGFEWPAAADLKIENDEMTELRKNEARMYDTPMDCPIFEGKGKQTPETK